MVFWVYILRCADGSYDDEEGMLDEGACRDHFRLRAFLMLSYAAKFPTHGLELSILGSGDVRTA